MDRTLTAPAQLHSSLPHTSWYLRLFAMVAQWQRNARTRRQLAQLDSRAMADVGISPSDRYQELEKPFWR